MSSNAMLWHQLSHAPSVGTPLGALADLADGHAQMLEWRHPQAPTDAPAFRYLLLRSGTTIRAYVNRCAHFGVPLAQKQEQLVFKAHTSLTCNVHYARYDWDSGHCLGGDCDGDGLLPIPVAVDACGQVVIV